MRVTFSGALLAAGAADPISTPCVGDWIAVRVWPDGRTTAEWVLARRTAFVRAAVTPGVSHGQLLAANVDVAVVVEGLHPEPDLGRIERFLALAWESGASPLVVLTKADLVPDPDGMRAEVAAAAPGVEVVAVSATTGAGLVDVEPYIGLGRTLAFLGPSGAGKSTLTNALAGAPLMVTRELRADGKGRHTTVHRELVMLPGGALVIDTPGLRSVGLTDVAESLELVFAEVEALAEQCKFSDCVHETEPGCGRRNGRSGSASTRRCARAGGSGRDRRGSCARALSDVTGVVPAHDGRGLPVVAENRYRRRRQLQPDALGGGQVDPARSDHPGHVAVPEGQHRSG